ncbi:unnamed protein product [Paramecium pentaurelia]|uniref:Uncharacterized protein n=1 Tax=Paramecium pentaurelia TaxID=43138 RepID=A0A8S1S8S3_9CILI|nr:unnamed protein product [Paramecium pentaurelia]
MNFIKGIFNKVVGTQQPLVDQEIFDFVILGTLFKQDEAKYTKLSSNTEFVFDKLTNDEFDHILIVRLQRASKSYNNTVSQKEGDFYFNISFFKSIYHSALSDEVEEFSIDLIDIQGIKWSLRMHFLKNTKSDNLKIQNFKLFLSKLIWIQRNKKALPKNLNELNDAIPAKQSSKLEMHNLVQQKQMKKTLKKVDRSILSQSTNRNRQEKEIVGDVINYFLQSDIDSIKQIYAGKLYVLYPELAEIRLINPLVIMALNIISKTECRMELYNQDRQLLLIQSLKEFISFEVDKDENYLSWVYFDGYNSIVIYFKFDVLDGATSMAFILQRSRINMKNKKNLQLDSSSSSIQFSTATTINLNETQVQQIQQKKQKKYIYRDDLHTIKEGLKTTKTKSIINYENDNLIILEDRNITFIKNNKFFQIDQQIKFDKTCLGNNSQKLILYQQFSQELHLINLGTETQEIVKLNFQIADVCSFEKQFILLNNSSVYILNEDKTIQKINQIDQNLKDHYIIIRSSINGSIVIGTQQGIVFVFDNIKTMKQVNSFEGLGDPIKDIVLSADEKFIIINNSQYIQFQQIITNHQNGYQQHLDLKPFPIRVQLNPEDLILMGIFNYPNFQHVRIDKNNKVIAAQLENLQVIWNIEQIINQSHNSYQIFILPEEIFDQQFKDQDLLILSESNLYTRECD